MKKKISILIVSTVIIGLVLVLVGISRVSQAAPEQMARKIIVFQPWFINEAAKEEIINRTGGMKIKNLDLINGMAVYLPAEAERVLTEKAEVLRIDDDEIVFAIGKPGCTCIYNGVCEPDLGEHPSCCDDCKREEESTPQQPAQEIAWGVTRIGAESAWSTSKGSAVKVAIIDSGIDLDHPDLKANIKAGYNTINPRKSWDDDNGHGTHVAGIVAALNNTIGVVGVAPEAHLYAVKVLNRRGIGFASDIIEGLGWCVEKGIQVANMSIGSSGCSESYHQAIIAAKNAEITIVAAAGNNGETGGSIVCPAKWPETIAVSATNIDDNLAYFSSYGEEINLAAPGQSIKSTWNDGSYKFGSGTSMATPHVTGVAALVIASRKASTPDEVRAVLKATAEPIKMGSSCPVENPAYCQGAGLVDAEAAVVK